MDQTLTIAPGKYFHLNLTAGLAKDHAIRLETTAVDPLSPKTTSFSVIKKISKIVMIINQRRSKNLIKTSLNHYGSTSCNQKTGMRTKWSLYNTNNAKLNNKSIKAIKEQNKTLGCLKL